MKYFSNACEAYWSICFYAIKTVNSTYSMEKNSLLSIINFRQALKDKNIKLNLLNNSKQITADGWSLSLSLSLQSYFPKNSIESSVYFLCILHRFSTIYVFDFYEVVFCTMKLHLTRDEICILNWPPKRPDII